MLILGISAYYHDSAAALVCDGRIAAASQEERFSRKKHDARFPRSAVAYCLREAGKDLAAVDYVVFYDKPLVKFERLLETYLSFAPRGFGSFTASMPIWLKEKLFLKTTLHAELSALAHCSEDVLPPLLFCEHHKSHAASAFFPSPFRTAAVLCIDGVGEWATTSAWLGNGRLLEPLWELHFPHSLGLLYSAFTAYAGFKVNSGEYKLMGLAPYGRPIYEAAIREHLIDIKQDGTFRLNMEYFNYCTGLTMTNEKFHRLFGGAPRQPETAITQRDMDVAASIQSVTEDVVLRLTRGLQKETQSERLCLAGGVALNCVANGKVIRDARFRDVWVQPAAGDAGGALGAALAAWHIHLRQERHVEQPDAMKGAFLGPKFDNDEVRSQLQSLGVVYRELSDGDLMPRVAMLLASENVIGWFQGRMEFGPRALGSRSILGDPRSPRMQSNMNKKIKYRESFRPFAPAVLAEKVSEYFDLDRPSPYMLLVADIGKGQRITGSSEENSVTGLERLSFVRSTLPAITHVDYSARIQTVHRETNPRFHQLIEAFFELTGCAVLVNTSFNVRGEPIVCTPSEAYRCFMRTEMDYLVIGNFLLAKTDQTVSSADGESWTNEFPLD